MIGYYRKHVVQLAERLQHLRGTPTDLDALVETQVYILKRVLATEAKITRHRRDSAGLRKALRSRRLPREETAELKRRIRFADDRIERCQWLLYVWRCFGDGIAFVYLDKWAVKPLLYNVETPDVKQPAGYMTGKVGLKREFSVVLEARAKGVPALLCDLTNSIRHGDVCLLGGSDPCLVEVKSSRDVSRRARRQLEDLKRIHDYLETDEATNVRGVEHMKRVELAVPEVNHQEVVNRMIEEALCTGRCVVEPEPGVRYVALGDTRRPDYRSMFAGLEKPIIYTLNDFKNHQGWGCYYPFTLSIRNPDSLYAFLKGDVFLLVVFDFARLQDIARLKGIELSILDGGGGWVYQLERTVNYEGGPPMVRISVHFAVRMALEFLSWEWLLCNEAKRLQGNE